MISWSSSYLSSRHCQLKVFNLLCSVVVLALTDFLSLLDGQLSFSDCENGVYGPPSSSGMQDCGLKLTLFYVVSYIIRFVIGVQVVRIAINFAQLASGKTNALYAQICLSLEIVVFAIFIKNVVRTFAGTDWITATDGRHPVYTNQNDPSQRPVIFACYILAIILTFTKAVVLIWDMLLSKRRGRHVGAYDNHGPPAASAPVQF